MDGSRNATRSAATVAIAVTTRERFLSSRYAAILALCLRRMRPVPGLREQRLRGRRAHEGDELSSCRSGRLTDHEVEALVQGIAACRRVGHGRFDAVEDQGANRPFLHQDLRKRGGAERAGDLLQAFA